MRSDLVTCSMVVAEEIAFDAEKGMNSVRNISNRLEVPCMPCVIRLSVLVRLWGMDVAGPHGARLGIADAGDALTGVTAPIVQRSQWSEGMIPGVNLGLSIRGLVRKEGNHAVWLHVEEEKTISLPLHVVACAAE